MRKIIDWLDANFLKWGVAFALAFIALYPKLPTIYIHHTWVYVRLEDFVISVLMGWYFLQLIRHKVKFPFSVGAPILLYWVVGLLSLLNSLLFIAPGLANFFPSVAALSYLRRIEYMGLFFVGFAAIKSVDDLKFYFKAFLITLSGVLIYGFCQKFYTIFWHWFPKLAEAFPFCFPSFQTGNEEFAKGIPLCLPFDSRITSTFAGHYDLAGWLIFFLPVLFAVSFLYPKRAQIGLWIMGLLSAMLLGFTASRVSIVAYFIGLGLTLTLIKKKKAIIPLFILSFIFIFALSGTTIRRFAQTFRTESVVTDSSGRVVGIASNSLPKDLQKKISQNPDTNVAASAPTQNLPLGTSYITIPQNTKSVQKTNVAVVQKSLSSTAAKQLNFDYGGVQISTISGNFTVQKVLVYDISFTTRIQGEWPNAWRAFLRNPFLGSGFATITLAADNDYFRNLGETGLMGILSFLFVFLVIFILMRETIGKLENPFARNFMLGVVGGVVALFANSIFYDTFEASKIAETAWIVLGLVAGTLYLVRHKTFSLFAAVKTIVTSNIFLMFYILVILIAITLPYMSNFFVADDFTWLRWGLSSVLSDIPHFFVNAQGFFYRPLDKTLMIVLFALFGFEPTGYHFFFTLIHFFIACTVFSLLLKLFNKKTLAFFGSLLFAILSTHGENVFWISTMSITLSTLFIMLGILQWIRFREKDSTLSYITTIALAGISLCTYEMSVVMPLLLAAVDGFIIKGKNKKLSSYIPFVVLDILYAIVRFTANVAPISGDYSYNFVHFIPNTVGNILGYLGLFIFGQNMLGAYTFIREGLRQNTIIIGASIVVGILILTVIALYAKRIWKVLLAQKNLSFGLVFSFIALLPFVGLGNITERYVYLGSIGFIIAFVWLLNLINQKVTSRVGFMLVSVLVLAWYMYQGYLLGQVGAQWFRAGEITQNTLGFFKARYPNLTSHDTIYINNLPIRQANAWIFPVGFSDGLWFVYRDQNPHVVITQTNAPAVRGDGKPYVFTFNPDGLIQEAK